jgi:hypothetical protein
MMMMMMTYKKGCDLESCGGAFCSGTWLCSFWTGSTCLLHEVRPEMKPPPTPLQAVKVKRIPQLSEIMTLFLNERPIKIHKKNRYQCYNWSIISRTLPQPGRRDCTKLDDRFWLMTVGERRPDRLYIYPHILFIWLPTRSSFSGVKWRGRDGKLTDRLHQVPSLRRRGVIPYAPHPHTHTYTHASSSTGATNYTTELSSLWALTTSAGAVIDYFRLA